MNRRTFFKSLAALPLAPAFAGPASAEQEVTHVNRGVCNTLEGLQNIETAEEYRLSPGRFSLVYFGTATSIYGAACGTDMDEMMAAVSIYGTAQIQRNVDLLLVYPKPANGDPETLVERYVRNGPFIGLEAADNRQLLTTTREYGGPYEIDRHTGAVKNHARSSKLIGPQGEFLRQYKAGTINFLITQDIEQTMQTYRPIPANECAPGIG